MPSGSKNNPTAKSELRSHYLALRKNIPDEKRVLASSLVTAKVLDLPVTTAAQLISIYISTKFEVSTRQLINALLKQNKQIFAPVIVEDSVVLRRLISLESCVPGQKGILEPPASSAIIHPAEIELFLVPGLSFDAHRYRLGYGKGYYDRLLAQTQGHKLGLAFTDQVCYQLPHHSHDIKMDQVLTDTILL